MMTNLVDVYIKKFKEEGGSMKELLEEQDEKLREELREELKEESERMRKFMIYIAASLAIFIGIVVALSYISSYRSPLLQGPPTYEGTIQNITFTYFGAANEPYTEVHLEGGITFAVLNHQKELVVGGTYQFWVEGKVLLRAREAT